MSADDRLKVERCPRIRARIVNDYRRGKTTSAPAVEFVRRTCDCETCSAWRASQRQLPAPVVG